MEAIMRNLKYKILCFVILATLLILTGLTPAFADSFFFSTGDVDGKMATASRPSSGGKIEIESADDFVLGTPMDITSATFTGLLTGDVSISRVVVEIYRVFPKDSTVPPSGNVPTRVNSPSDVAFETRDSLAGTLSFVISVLSPSFTTLNSVLNGIHPLPNQTTGGEGPVGGQEVLFDVTFSTPFLLPADHYFFVPQIEMTDAAGEFYWLSAPKPIVPPGTPFSPDLQSWIRNEDLAPDWLRIGTDIVGGAPPPTFNAVFSLSGETISAVPEPTTLLLLGSGLIGLVGYGRKKFFEK
jgi:hypothetical protein